MTRLGDDLYMPFEDDPTGGRIDLHGAWLAGGVVVMGAVLPVPGAGLKPALVFRFALASGDFAAPMVLVLDDDQAAKTTTLVGAAVNAALQATTEARRHGTFGSGA